MAMRGRKGVLKDYLPLRDRRSSGVMVALTHGILEPFAVSFLILISYGDFRALKRQDWIEGFGKGDQDGWCGGGRFEVISKQVKLIDKIGLMKKEVVVTLIDIAHKLFKTGEIIKEKVNWVLENRTSEDYNCICHWVKNIIGINLQKNHELYHIIKV